MVELQKGLAWNHEKCKWTGSEANWLPLWCDPLLLRFGGEVNTCRLQYCPEAVTSTWWVVCARHVNHFQRNGKSARCWSVPADLPYLPAPPSMLFNEELQWEAGFDHFIHGKDCEKHIYFGNTQQHIYIYTCIYLQMLFLRVVYMCLYYLVLAMTFNQSFKSPLMSCQQNLP